MLAGPYRPNTTPRKFRTRVIGALPSLSKFVSTGVMFLGMGKLFRISDARVKWARRLGTDELAALASH
jgi:hypothetical protein